MTAPRKRPLTFTFIEFGVPIDTIRTDLVIGRLGVQVPSSAPLLTLVRALDHCLDHRPVGARNPASH